MPYVNVTNSGEVELARAGHTYPAGETVENVYVAPGDLSQIEQAKELGYEVVTDEPGGGGVTNPLVAMNEFAAAGRAAALRGAGLEDYASQEPSDAPGDVASGEEPEASERAQELAHELGVDLSGVEGSGKDGKVTADDVRKAAKSDEE